MAWLDLRRSLKLGWIEENEWGLVGSRKVGRMTGRIRHTKIQMVYARQLAEDTALKVQVAAV